MNEMDEIAPIINRKHYVLGLGSNIGDRMEHLLSVLGEFSRIGIELQKTSTVYETEPMVFSGAPKEWEKQYYLNCAVLISTTYSPWEMLKVLKMIEKQHGRLSDAPRWSPRTIDIDILLSDQDIVSTANLTIPHPGLLERVFTLIPTAEVVPEWIHPVSGLRIHEHAKLLCSKPEKCRPFCCII